MSDEAEGEGGPSEQIAVSDVQALAKSYSTEAVETLRSLLKCRGRQSMVAAVAATSLFKIGNPDVTKEQLRKMLDELIADAKKRKG